MLQLWEVGNFHRQAVVDYEKYVNPKGEQKNYYLTHTIRAKGRGKAGKIRRFQFGEDALFNLYPIL